MQSKDRIRAQHILDEAGEACKYLASKLLTIPVALLNPSANSPNLFLSEPLLRT